MGEERFTGRGSGEPGEGTQGPTVGHDLEEDLLAEGGGVPRVDASDVGDGGAPVADLGKGGGSGPGSGARYSGGASAGAKVVDLRDRASALRQGKESPAGGGPAPTDDAS
jgi:hypothetical protein